MFFQKNTFFKKSKFFWKYIFVCNFFVAISLVLPNEEIIIRAELLRVHPVSESTGVPWAWHRSRSSRSWTVTLLSDIGFFFWFFDLISKMICYRLASWVYEFNENYFMRIAGNPGNCMATSCKNNMTNRDFIHLIWFNVFSQWAQSRIILFFN